jgi:hypothetical protein
VYGKADAGCAGDAIAKLHHTVYGEVEDDDWTCVRCLSVVAEEALKKADASVDRAATMSVDIKRNAREARNNALMMKGAGRDKDGKDGLTRFVYRRVVGGNRLEQALEETPGGPLWRAASPTTSPCSCCEGVPAPLPMSDKDKKLYKGLTEKCGKTMSKLATWRRAGIYVLWQRYDGTFVRGLLEAEHLMFMLKQQWVEGVDDEEGGYGCMLCGHVWPVDEYGFPHGLALDHLHLEWLWTAKRRGKRRGTKVWGGVARSFICNESTGSSDDGTGCNGAMGSVDDDIEIREMRKGVEGGTQMKEECSVGNGQIERPIAPPVHGQAPVNREYYISVGIVFPAAFAGRLYDADEKVTGRPLQND